MPLLPLLMGSTARLLGSLVSRPAASVATVLYYGGALPRSLSLGRLVCDDVLDENYWLHLLIYITRFFW